MLSQEALYKLNEFNFNTVLDVGCGQGQHTDYFKSKEKLVTSTDYYSKFDGVIVGDYLDLNFKQHDLVWCSHVLEHQVNVNIFLNKLISDTVDGGILAITVPPLKHEIVGGHVNLWNPGLLLYRMILCGLDCSQAAVKVYDYNISVIVKKKMFDMPNIRMANGDLEILSEYFPIPVKQGFNGQNININW